MSLSIGVAKIFATDVKNLSKKLRASQKRGVSFEGTCPRQRHANNSRPNDLFKM